MYFLEALMENTDVVHFYGVLNSPKISKLRQARLKLSDASNIRE